MAGSDMHARAERWRELWMRVRDELFTTAGDIHRVREEWPACDVTVMFDQVMNVAGSAWALGTLSDESIGVIMDGFDEIQNKARRNDA